LKRAAVVIVVHEFSYHVVKKLEAKGHERVQVGCSWPDRLDGDAPLQKYMVKKRAVLLVEVTFQLLGAN
jgi:hypothetical protein